MDYIKTISYGRKTAKRMMAIRDKLRLQDYNDEEEVTWDNVMEYLIRGAGEYDILKPVVKEKKKSKPFRKNK